MIDATTPPDVAGDNAQSVHERLTAMLDKELDLLPDAPEKPAVEESAPPTDVPVDGSTEKEPETVAKESEDVEETGDDSDDAGWMPESLDDIADALGVTVDKVAETLKTRTKVDGEVGTATLKDLIESYQFRQHLDKRSQADAEERRKFQESRQKAETEAQERHQRLDDTIKAAEMLLFSEYNNIDWTDLKQNDPTEYMLRQTELQNRYSQLEGYKEKAAKDRQAEQEKQVQALQQAQVEAFNRQWDVVTRDRPKWLDNDTAREVQRDLVKYLKRYGLTEQDFVGQPIPPVVWALAADSKELSEIKSKTDPKKKQLKDVPKFVRSGARRDQKDVDVRRVAELRKRSKAGDKQARHQLLVEKFSR